MPVADAAEGVQVGNGCAAPQLIVEDLKEMEKGSRMDEEGGRGVEAGVSGERMKDSADTKEISGDGETESGDKNSSGV